MRGKISAITGSYIGDGTSGRTIDFGQSVSLVIVQAEGMRTRNTDEIGTVVGKDCIHGLPSGANGFTHTGTGILIHSQYFNITNQSYRYIALST